MVLWRVDSGACGHQACTRSAHGSDLGERQLANFPAGGLDRARHWSHMLEWPLGRRVIT